MRTAKASELRKLYNGNMIKGHSLCYYYQW